MRKQHTERGDDFMKMRGNVFRATVFAAVIAIGRRDEKNENNAGYRLRKLMTVPISAVRQGVRDFIKLKGV